eukprot:5838352-Pleurochrysis_carterae.AAC.1
MVVSSNGVGAHIEAYIEAEIKSRHIKKENSEEKSNMRERMKTAKTILLEQFCARSITCAHIEDDAGKRSYIRVMHVPVGLRSFGSDDVLHWIRAYRDGEATQSLSAFVEEKVKPIGTKPSLILSDHGERGGEVDIIPSDLSYLAEDLLACRGRLNFMGKAERQRLAPLEEIKKKHAPIIVDFIMHKDPVHRMQRVTVPQQDRALMQTYFLKCDEYVKTAPVTYKRLLPLLSPIFPKLQKLSSEKDKASLSSEMNAVLTHAFETHRERCTTRKFNLTLML